MAENHFFEIVDNVLRSKNEATLKYSSFTKAVIEKLLENGERISMIDCDTEKEWTANEMVNAVERLGCAFMNVGVSKGDVVFFYCPNNDLHTIALLAIWAIGAVSSGSLQNNPLREVQSLITVSGAVHLIGCKENIEICSQLKRQLKQLKTLFSIDDNSERNDNISLKSLLSANIDSEQTAKFYEIMSEIKPNGLLKVNFSSGTTGIPKAISLTHSNLLSAVAYPITELITEDDTLACLPHYCHAGRTTILSIGLLQGSKLAVISEFNSLSFIKLVQKYSITVTMLVPAAINLLNNTHVNSLSSYTLRKVLVTGEILSSHISSKYISKFNPSYFGQIYGSTEMGMTAAKPKFDGIDKIVTAGIPSDGVQIKVIDTNSGEKLGRNKIGEILMKGPQLSPGYVNNQTANEQNYDESGFFKTGDLGYYNDDGYLYVTDRIKETLKYNSQQVSPSELESILLSHESVMEAAVVGVADEVWGQLPKAFVVLKQEFRNEVTEQQLIEFVDLQVADHKRLRGGLSFLEALNKTVIGKVDRKALKSL